MLTFNLIRMLKRARLSLTGEKEFSLFGHAILTVFQILGIVILGLMCINAIAVPPSQSPTDVNAAVPIMSRLTGIGFVLLWNVAVYFMRRDSLRALKEIKWSKEKEYPLNEDRLASLVLGRTLVFIFYSFLAFMVFGLVAFFGKEMGWRSEMSDTSGFAILACLVFTTLLLTIKGWLPGARREITNPLSEKQLVWAANALSGFAWVLDLVWRTHVTTHVVSSAMILFVLVFFLTKSIVSGRPRPRVLTGMILPTAHFIYVALNR